LIFIDAKNNIEVVVRELSTSTNFNAKQINTHSELINFAKEIGFPEHALILRKSKDDVAEIYKGIQDFRSLENIFQKLVSTYNSVYVETDMRALYNPTRMSVIEQATYKLIQKIKSTCPTCNMPGFGIFDAKKGLKCNLCGLPTNSILSYIYICQHCKFEKEELYPSNKTSEDPMYCNNCNP
jgi:Sec7-like guanine-nucleotide exchange factor